MFFGAQIRAIASYLKPTKIISEVPVSKCQAVAAARQATESSDLFFATGAINPSVLGESQRIAPTLESLLSKAGSNFELEITSTRIMTMNEPLILKDWSSQYSYHCQLLLACGASSYQ